MRPKVVLHNALSADGRMDSLNVDMELYYGLAGTFREDATLCGADTMLASPGAAPLEDMKFWEGRKIDSKDKRPLLVVVDSQGRVRNWHHTLASGHWRDGVALASRKTPTDYIQYLDTRRIQCIVSGDERVNLAEALDMLNHDHGVKRVRVDSGGKLNGILLRAGLVDEISMLVHPVFVGGTTPRSMYVAPDLPTGCAPLELKLIKAEKLKRGVMWLKYRVIRPKGQ